MVLAPVLQMQQVKKHPRRKREMEKTAVNIKYLHLEGINSSQLLKGFVTKASIAAICLARSFTALFFE
jgi:hypothetical protein